MREVFERLRGLAVGLERIDVLDQAGVLVGDGGEAELDLLIAVRRHREDLQLEQVVADVLEQAGVLGAADDARCRSRWALSASSSSPAVSLPSTHMVNLLTLAPLGTGKT